MGSVSDLQHDSCIAPAAPVSPAPHDRMPAVSAVAHDGSAHVPVPIEHAVEAQSVPFVHFLSRRHAGALYVVVPSLTPSPPQSTSVSPPFFTPSLDVGTTHALAVHASSWQSAFALHAFMSAHFGAVAPPQSTSVSSPSFFPSVGDGSAQVPMLHAPAQSSFVLHACPAAHGCVAATVPPQSTPVSPALRRPSMCASGGGSAHFVSAPQ